jgi:hypothetical protein
MTALAAIQGDFVDIRFVKGRKVCQIVIEIPIEAGVNFVSIFGTPNPATSVPVALARLDGEGQERKGGKLAQRAGIICNEGSFRVFAKESKLGSPSNSAEAAAMLRAQCGVESRAELDHNNEAARKFTDLEASYKAWMTAA